MRKLQKSEMNSQEENHPNTPTFNISGRILRIQSKFGVFLNFNKIIETDFSLGFQITFQLTHYSSNLSV